jgi:hypothetical protein
MVLFFLTALLSSLVILSLMLGFKYYELSTGNLLLGERRQSVSRFSHRTAFLFGTALPHYIRYEARRAYRGGWVFVHAVLARAVAKVEHWLEGLLNRVQEKAAHPRNPGEASAFLREVGEHKKRLADTSEVHRIDQE